MFQIRVQAPGEDGAAAMFDDGVYGEEAKISEEEKSSSVSPLLPQHRGLDSALQREEEDGDGEDKQWPDANFLTGNPQVRVTTGKLRFYRPDQPYVHKLSPFAATTATSSAYQQLPHERNTLLCIVTVPSHMSPVELLEFLAGFRDDIASVRVLQDPDRSNCMALLQFVTQDRADQFFMVRCVMCWIVVDALCGVSVVHSNDLTMVTTSTLGAHRDVLQLDRARSLQDRVCAQYRVRLGRGWSNRQFG
jgi:hypothetical protein